MTKMYKPLLALFFCCIIAALPVSAQMMHPIDEQLMECYAAAGGRESMVSCEAQGYKMWKDETERLYESTLAVIPESARTGFIVQQSAWLQLHDAEVRSIQQLFMDRPAILASTITDIVRKRAMVLQAYYDLLIESGN